VLREGVEERRWLPRLNQPAPQRRRPGGIDPKWTGAGLTVGSGFEWGDLAIVALWGLGGLLVAIRYFRWTPRH
jgi:hypothetical protein